MPLTRAQAKKTLKNPVCPLIIFREGETVNSLLNLTEGEKEHFLSVMQSTKEDDTKLKKKDGAITIPGVKLVEYPAPFTHARLGNFNKENTFRIKSNGH